jgi:aryl-alcohol dehydrogenase-like predicted oxidoreductase
MLVGMNQDDVDRLVADSLGREVNYFDVAPSYGEGEAEDKLGSALEPHRSRVFLSGKTLARSAADVIRELEDSLRRLRSEYFDLYQFHAVDKRTDVESIFALGGGLDALLRAREQGLIRYIGFSSHSVPLSLSMLDRFDFDALLFPINYVCYARGNFGPQVLEKAQSRGVARIALKTLAHTPRRHLEARRFPNCWYRPIDEPALAMQALRFALSEDVTAVLPPADERLYRMALDFAPAATPLSAEEREQLLESARGLRPLMRARR